MPVATGDSPRSDPAHKMEKMEERKRPASTTNNDEVAPPRKRHATNGTNHEDYEKYENQSEEAWITNFTKGAIYRRMNEYRREANTFSNRLEELHKRSLYHDDHLRVIDAWWRQTFDELELLINAKVPKTDPSQDSLYLSHVNFEDLSDFQHHLDDKKRTLVSRAESLISRIASNRGETNDKAATLENEVALLLAQQKEYLVKLDRLSVEKEQLSEQLNTATLRYFKAEKKLDRTKSLQVAKLEDQARSRDSNNKTNGNSNAKGKSSTPSVNTSELQKKLDEESASVKKQKEQIDDLLNQLKTLQEDNTKLRVAKDVTTDEEYLRTDLYKAFRAKTDELIKQVNHLEATNNSIREECTKLLSERTSYKKQLETDSKSITADLDAELLARENDLTRIRASRDELQAEVSNKKLILERERASVAQLTALVASKDDMIKSLETRISRLEPSEDTEMSDGDKTFDNLSEAELRTQIKELKAKYDAINREIPPLSSAYTKANSLANAKVKHLANLEAKLDQVLSDKGKVDAKYVAARRDAEFQKTELHMLRREVSKSGEIIAQLKEVESANRTMAAMLEKQLAHLKQTNISLSIENKKLEAATGEANRKSEAAVKEVSSLKDLVATKDSTVAELREKALTKETEAERLRSKMDNLSRDRDALRKQIEGSSSEVENQLRTLMLCSVCKDKFKDTCIKVCGHLFCKECVENRVHNRMRKCPTCGKAFGKDDVMTVHH